MEVTGTVLGHIQSAGGQFVFYVSDRDEEESCGGTPFPLTPADFGDVVSRAQFGPAGNTMTFIVQRHDARTELHALDLDNFLIFSDGFESGDLSAWSVVIPSAR